MKNELLLASTLAFILAIQCPTHSAAQQTSAKPETLELKCRDGSTLSAESWRITVPENRSKSDSRNISLAVLRVKSPLPDRGLPVFYLAGGPGGSGFGQMKRMVEGGGKKFFELIGGDIIGIDQRGVGLSEPNLETDTRFDFDVKLPGNRANMLRKMKAVCQAEAEKWREQGVDLDGYNTVENADDIEAIRQALGYEKIVLWGGSYGTHLGMTVIRRHGDHVERALLTGPEGPNHTFKLPSDSQKALQQISDLVAQDKEMGEAIPDMMKMLETVLDRLEDSPAYAIVDEQKIGISKFDVQRLIARDLGTIRGSADSIPGHLQAMHDGDFSAVAKELVEDRRESGIWSVMNMVMDCASGATNERLQQIETESVDCLIGDTANFPHAFLAESWNVKDLGDEFRSNFETDVPILFIIGNMDSRTPIKNAKELMQEFTNANLVVVNNAGHNDVPMGMPPLRKIWSEFLSTGKTQSATLDAPPILFRSLKPTVKLEMDKNSLEKFAGDYKFESGMVFSIRAGQDKLIGTIPGKGDFDLNPTSEMTFEAAIPQIPPLTFQIDQEGNVVSFEGGDKTAMRIGGRFESVKLKSEQLDAFVGSFDYGRLGVMTVRRDGSKLLAQIPGQEAQEVRPVSKTELRWVRLDARLVFVENEYPKFKKAVHYQNGQRFDVMKTK